MPMGEVTSRHEAAIQFIKDELDEQGRQQRASAAEASQVGTMQRQVINELVTQVQAMVAKMPGITTTGTAAAEAGAE